MPIIGVIASQISGHLAPTPSYYSIATTTVGSGGTSSVTFSSIPSGYTHLQLRWLVRTDRAVTDGDYFIMQFNGINTTGSYYSQHYLYGNGTNALAAADGAYTAIEVERVASAGMTANAFGAGIIDILDYTNTNKNKVARMIGGLDTNAGTTSNTIRLASGMLLSTPAITSITLNQGAGTNFVQYSQFALYGVK